MLPKKITIKVRAPPKKKIMIKAGMNIIIRNQRRGVRKGGRRERAARGCCRRR